MRSILRPMALMARLQIICAILIRYVFPRVSGRDRVEAKFRSESKGAPANGKRMKKATDILYEYALLLLYHGSLSELLPIADLISLAVLSTSR